LYWIIGDEVIVRALARVLARLFLGWITELELRRLGVGVINDTSEDKRDTTSKSGDPVSYLGPVRFGGGKIVVRALLGT
jgi:hypothetical protein